jgi:hypothetical protein
MLLLLVVVACEWPAPPWYAGMRCTAVDTVEVFPADLAAASHFCSEVAEKQATSAQTFIFAKARCIQAWQQDSVIRLTSVDLDS